MLIRSSAKWPLRRSAPASEGEKDEATIRRTLHAWRRCSRRHHRLGNQLRQPCGSRGGSATAGARMPLWVCLRAHINERCPEIASTADEAVKRTAPVSGSSREPTGGEGGG